MAIVVNGLILVPYRIHTALGCFSHMLVADLDLQRLRWTGGWFFSSGGVTCAWFSSGVSQLSCGSSRYEGHALDNKSRCLSHMEENIPCYSMHNLFFPKYHLCILPAEPTGTLLVPAQQREVGSTILSRHTGSLMDAGWVRGHLFVLLGSFEDCWNSYRYTQDCPQALELKAFC